MKVSEIKYEMNKLKIRYFKINNLFFIHDVFSIGKCPYYRTSDISDFKTSVNLLESEQKKLNDYKNGIISSSDAISNKLCPHCFIEYWCQRPKISEDITNDRFFIDQATGLLHAESADFRLFCDISPNLNEVFEKEDKTFIKLIKVWMVEENFRRMRGKRNKNLFKNEINKTLKKLDITDFCQHCFPRSSDF